MFDDTPEGADFWDDIHREYRLWFQHHDRKSQRLCELFKLRDSLKFEVDNHPEEDDWEDMKRKYFDTLYKIEKLES